MKTDEIFEGIGDNLAGFVDINTIASMLPDLSNVTLFQNAINKVRLGQGTDLTFQERQQLALAFISLLGLPAPQKSTFIRLLMSVQSATTPAQAQTNQAAAPAVGQTPQQAPTNTAPTA